MIIANKWRVIWYWPLPDMARRDIIAVSALSLHLELDRTKNGSPRSIVQGLAYPLVSGIFVKALLAGGGCDNNRPPRR